MSNISTAMPTYCYANPRLRHSWIERIRKINRRFKELEREDMMPVMVRIEERR